MAAREADREDAVAEHRHRDVDRDQRRVVQRGHERADLLRQRERVAQQEQRHADRDEGDGADRVAPGQEEVAAQDAEGKGDAELVQVAPRATADEVGADEHADAERMNDSQTNSWPVLPAAVSAPPELFDRPMVIVVVPPPAPAPAVAGRGSRAAMVRRPNASSDVWATSRTKAMAVVTVPMSTR